MAPLLAVLRRAWGRLAPAQGFTSGRSVVASTCLGAGILPVRRLALGALLVAAGCSGDDDAGGGTSADDLADRVVAVLEADSGAVDGDLEGAAVSCPPVRDPQPGDRATCDVRLDGGGDVEVDVEFDEGGAITVVAVIPG